MNSCNVSLEIPGRLEAVVAEVAHEVVALVDAPDVIVQVRTSFELFSTPVASEGHLFLVDQLDVVLHS